MEELRLAYLELLKKTIIDLHRSGFKEYRPVVLDSDGVYWKKEMDPA